jgi:hypothetical protein
MYRSIQVVILHNIFIFFEKKNSTECFLKLRVKLRSFVFECLKIIHFLTQSIMFVTNDNVHFEQCTYPAAWQRVLCK